MEVIISILKKRSTWLILLCILSFYSLRVGILDFSYSSLFSLDESTVHLALLTRIPRLISILVVGASLSVAGLIMQTISKNKFVSPTTAGVSDWCRFGILIAIIFFGGSNSFIKILVAVITSVIGSTLFLRLLHTIKFKDTMLVPLIGMMLGGIVSAVTTFFAYQFDIIQNMSSWMQGNFSLIMKGNYELLYLGIPFLILSSVYAYRFTIVSLGDNFAKNLGLNYKQTVFIGILIVSVITSIVTVSVGTIPFVGLIIPNLVSFQKGDNLKHTIVDVAILGSLFVLICDLLGRVLIAPYEIPISVVVSIVGSIIFLFQLFGGRKHA